MRRWCFIRRNRRGRKPSVWNRAHSFGVGDLFRTSETRNSTYRATNTEYRAPSRISTHGFASTRNLAAPAHTSGFGESARRSPPGCEAWTSFNLPFAELAITICFGLQNVKTKFDQIRTSYSGAATYISADQPVILIFRFAIKRQAIHYWFAVTRAGRSIWSVSSGPTAFLPRIHCTRSDHAKSRHAGQEKVVSAPELHKIG
jgi:hypothetical protein